MECADDTTFDHRPKTINGRGMDCSNNIFTLAMMDNAVIKPPIKIAIARVVISGDEAYFVRHGFFNKKKITVK